MRKFIVPILAMGFFLAAGTCFAAQVKNQRYLVEQNGSWSSTYTFYYQGTCGTNCNAYYVSMDLPSFDIDGMIVYIKIEKDYPLYYNNWYYWDSDDDLWHNTCDLEGYYSQDSTWKYYIGKEQAGLGNDRVCRSYGDHTAKVYYRYYNGGTTYQRQYAGDCWYIE